MNSSDKLMNEMIKALTEFGLKDGVSDGEKVSYYLPEYEETYTISFAPYHDQQEEDVFLLIIISELRYFKQVVSLNLPIKNIGVGYVIAKDYVKVLEKVELERRLMD